MTIKLFQIDLIVTIPEFERNRNGWRYNSGRGLNIQKIFYCDKITSNIKKTNKIYNKVMVEHNIYNNKKNDIDNIQSETKKKYYLTYIANQVI